MGHTNVLALSEPHGRVEEGASLDKSERGLVEDLKA